jgi:hypothetical protein
MHNFLFLLIPFCSTTFTRDFERRRKRHSVIGMGYGLDGPGFESRQGNETFLFSKPSRPDLEPIQPPIQWVARYFLGLRRPGRDDDHSHLTPRLRTGTAIPRLRLYTFMELTRTTSPFYLLVITDGIQPCNN